MIDYSKTALEILQDVISHSLEEHSPTKDCFESSAILAYILHCIVRGQSRASTSVLEATRQMPFKKLLGTIIHTAPLGRQRRSPLWHQSLAKRESLIKEEEWLYLKTVSDYLGNHYLGQEFEITTFFSRKIEGRHPHPTTFLSRKIEGRHPYSYTLQESFASSIPSRLHSVYDYVDMEMLKSWFTQYRPTGAYLRDSNKAGTWQYERKAASPGIMAQSESERIRIPEYFGEISSVATAWTHLVNAEYVGTYAQRLAEIVRAYPHRYLPESDIKIFVDNNGMIGLCPGDTLPGDEIWEANDLDPLLIARKTAAGFDIVARSSRYAASTYPLTKSSRELLFYPHLAFVSLPEK